MIVEEWCPILPHCFVGNNAFSLTQNRMKPHPNKGLTEEQTIFIYRLSPACRLGENAFGILSSKFRVFHSTLCVKHEVIGGDWRQNENSNLETLVVPGMNHTRKASQVRNLLSKYVNGPTQVSWQWKVPLV